MFGWLRSFMDSRHAAKLIDLHPDAQVLTLQEGAELFFSQPSTKDLKDFLGGYVRIDEFWAKHFIGWRGLRDSVDGRIIPIDGYYKSRLLSSNDFVEMVAEAISELPPNHELKWLEQCWGANPKAPHSIAGEDGFIFISDRTNGIVYEKVYSTIVGIGYENPDGTPRKENFTGLKQGEQVYLFWHKNNPKDKNAVAVFPARGLFGQLRGSDQLGYLPREDAKEVMAKVKQGFSVLAEIDYLKEWYPSDSRWDDDDWDDDDWDDDEDVRYDCRLRLKFYVPDSAGIEELLRFKYGLPPSTVKALLEGGVSSVDDLARMSDQQLLAIKGIGPKALARIRGSLPEERG